MPEREEKTAFRLEVVREAMEIGVNRAAIKHAIAYVTVKKWLQNYQEQGADGLKRQPRHQIEDSRFLSTGQTEAILKLKKEHPDWSAARIISELNLDCSVQAINKKIRQAGIQKERRVAEKTGSPFTIMIADITRLTDRDFNNDLPDYQINLIDLATGFLFTAFSYEKSNLAMAIFLDYILEYLISQNIDCSRMKIITGQGQEFISYSKKRNSLCMNVLQNKFQTTVLTKPFKEKLKYLRERVIFSKKQFTDNTDLLLKSFILTIHYNNFRPQKRLEDHTPVALLKEALPDFDPRVLNIPAVIVDQHINKIGQLDIQNSYWSLSREKADEVLKRTFRHFSMTHIDSLYNFSNREALHNLEVMISVAKIHQNTDLLVSALQLRVNLYRVTGEWYKSELDIKNSLEQLAECKSAAVKIKVIRNLACQYSLNGQYDLAIDTYKQAIELAKEENDLKKTASLYQDISLPYKDNDKIAESKKYLLEAISLAEKHNWGTMLASAYGNMAIICHREFDHEQEKRYLTKSIEMCRKFKLTGGLISNLINLATIYSEEWKLDECLKANIQALKAIWLSHHRQHLTKIYANLGVYFTKKYQFDRASRYYLKQIRCAEQTGDLFALAQNCENLALNYHCVDDSKKSMECLDRAHNYYLSINHVRANHIVYLKARLLFLGGNFQQAQETLYGLAQDFTAIEDPLLQNRCRILNLSTTGILAYQNGEISRYHSIIQQLEAMADQIINARLQPDLIKKITSEIRQAITEVKKAADKSE